MLIVANWKAYVQSKIKAKQLFETAKKLAKGETEIVLAPSAPYLGMLAVGNTSKVEFAGQNISVVTGGAATGEITAQMLAEIGATYVIVGHSERRALGETDQIVAEKTKIAIANKLTPIVCIGEHERDVDAKYLTLLRAQLHAVLDPLSPKERARVVIAYEPIWAIGKTANDSIKPQDLEEMILYIRKVLGVYFPGKGAEKIRIIYGGSVEPTNIKALAQVQGVNGFLPGHASTDSDIFSTLVKNS